MFRFSASLRAFSIRQGDVFGSTPKFTSVVREDGDVDRCWGLRSVHLPQGVLCRGREGQHAWSPVPGLASLHLFVRVCSEVPPWVLSAELMPLLGSGNPYCRHSWESAPGRELSTQ